MRDICDYEIGLAEKETVRLWELLRQYNQAMVWATPLSVDTLHAVVHESIRPQAQCGSFYSCLRYAGPFSGHLSLKTKDACCCTMLFGSSSANSTVNINNPTDTS